MGEQNIKFKGYKVYKSNFELNNNFSHEGDNILMNPGFRRRVVSIDKNNYEVRLSVIIEKEYDHPFFAEVEIGGMFETRNWENEENKWIIGNSTAILFPFLRTTLSNLTINANINPYILPVININKLFEEEGK